MKKSKKLILNIIVAVFIAIFSIAFVSCNNDDLTDSNFSFGVWWWDYRLSDEYLHFASNNGINEIYYCNSKFNQQNADFIYKANQLDIDVYWLCGEYQWIDDYSLFYSKMEQFLKFQSEYSSIYKGIHLDVEPHQHPNWKTDRENLIIQYIDFVKTITKKYDYIKFDFDLPFWLHDIVNYDGQIKEAYKFILDYADRVFIMSYRDNGEKIIEVAKEELAYAKQENKKIFLSAETSEQENMLTFFEEGKEYLYSQIELLKNFVNQDFGFAIHHIKSWYNLKD